MNGTIISIYHLAIAITMMTEAILQKQPKECLIPHTAWFTLSMSLENLLMIRPVGVTSKNKFIGAPSTLVIIYKWNLVAALKIMYDTTLLPMNWENEESKERLKIIMANLLQPVSQTLLSRAHLPMYIVKYVSSNNLEIKAILRRIIGYLPPE